MNTYPLIVPADHPAYAGHFPGMPVLPGVVLLDALLHALQDAGQGSCVQWEIGSAKFQSAVRPGEALSFQHEMLANGAIRFAIRTADRAVASGTLVPARADAGRSRGDQG